MKKPHVFTVNGALVTEKERVDGCKGCIFNLGNICIQDRFYENYFHIACDGGCTERDVIYLRVE